MAMRVTPTKDDLLGGRPIVDDTVIKGAKSVPRHIFEQLNGQGCYTVLMKKVAKFSRKQSRYKAFSFAENDDIYDRMLETAFDLDDIDPRASSVLGHGAYRQQGVGVIPPTAHKRKMLQLPDPFQDKQTVGGKTYDSLYLECIDVIAECLKEGVRQQFGDNLEEAIAHVVVKKTSMKGAPKCWHGSDASTTFQKDVLRVMYDSKEGLYTFAYKDDFIITIGERAQDAKMIVDEKGNYVPKYRSSAVFRQKADDGVVFADTYDGDGIVGKRMRHVFNMPMITNMVLMTVNSFYIDNMSAKMRMIFKHTPESIQSLAGQYVHCTDFSGFDTTIPPEVRHYAADRLYSKEAAQVAKDMDRYPISGVYTEHNASAPEGERDIPIFYYIDRSDPAIAAQFSPLSSGTGDTALMGRVLGLADQLRRTCLLVNKTPSDVMSVGNPDDTKCLGAQAMRNQGDDAATIIDAIAKAMGMDRKKVSYMHYDVMQKTKIFDIDLERPGKMIGYLFWSPDPLEFPVWAVSNDPVAMLSNNIFREHGYNSPLRSDEYVGLAGSLSLYEQTCRPVMGDDFDAFVDRLLYVIDCPLSHSEIIEEGERRLADPETYIRAKYAEGIDDADDIDNVDDSMKADYAKAKLAQLFNLKNPDELDWKVDRRDLIDKAPKELLDHIAIIVDPKLTTNARKFLNI